LKKPLIIACAIVTLVGLLFAYVLLRPDSENNVMTEPSTKAQTQVVKEAPKSNVNQTSSGYIDYSPGIIKQTSGTKILYFHADWCPQCRALEADIKANSVPKGTTIIKADFDSSQKLRAKYGVTLQTTLVRVDDNGSEIKKFVAYQNPTLEAVVTNLL
jgi:thiol-disulfide isomerase/thioredoxin